MFILLFWINGLIKGKGYVMKFIFILYIVEVIWLICFIIIFIFFLENNLVKIL